MKKTLALVLSVLMVASLAACGSSKPAETTTAAPETTAAAETTEAETEPETEAEEPVVSVVDIAYGNYGFDYTDEIAAEVAALTVEPVAADIAIEASIENGASGAALVQARDGSEKYFMNALVAGEKVTLTAKGGAKITEAASTAAGSDIKVADDKASVSFTPAVLKVNEDGSIQGEEITVKMEDGVSYTVNTVSEMLPGLLLTGDGVASQDAGVYTFIVDQELIRLNSDKEVVYFRDLSCIGDIMANNFSVSEADGKNYYSFTIVTNTKLSHTGYTNGVFVVMDEDYKDIDLVTMAANDDPNHTHGPAFLDMHEFSVLGEGHYATLSYIPLEVELPSGIEGVNGTQTAYVWAGIIQEVKDGKVVAEINTTDYPVLYSSSVERMDYAASTLEGTVEDCMDYVHINSMDYIFNADGTIKKMMVSMRNQDSVYMFDMATGAIEWILGGKESTFTGYDEISSTRSDPNGVEFTALTVGQHNARFVEINDDKTLVISIFDNQTGTFPFMWDNGSLGGINTLTRMLKLKLDPKSGTVEVLSNIDGHSLDAISGRCHTADHCGSVKYASDSSVLIGWGLNIPLCTDKPIVAQFGWARGDLPIFTDYNEAQNTISLELNVVRSAARQAMIAAGECQDFSLYSYRTYKNEK